MRTFSLNDVVFAAIIGLLTVVTTDAQDTGTELPRMPVADTGTDPLDPTPPVTDPVPLPTDTPVPTDPTLPPEGPAPVPVEPLPPDSEPAPEPAPWTWQHQTQNQQGTVTNLHDWTRSQDGDMYSYQHSVTRPNGSHTQLREYSRTEDGYQLLRQQRFYTPDGTLLRDHSMSVTGTDPYNYQRQMTHTFRDGRTMEKTFTRSYDGTTGTMERSFIGPNGQVRQFERPWTPDDLADTETPIVDPTEVPTTDTQLPAPDAGLPTTDHVGTDSPSIVDPLAPTVTPEAEEGFLSWLNPFKKRDSKRFAGSSSTTKRSGFTVGSFGHSRRLTTVPPGQARKASGLTTSSQMRSMKTKLKQPGPPPHAAANLHGKAGKKF